jgi:hypothetical protein
MSNRQLLYALAYFLTQVTAASNFTHDIRHDYDDVHKLVIHGIYRSVRWLEGLRVHRSSSSSTALGLCDSNREIYPHHLGLV